MRNQNAPNFGKEGSDTGPLSLTATQPSSFETGPLRNRDTSPEVRSSRCVRFNHSRKARLLRSLIASMFFAPAASSGTLASEAGLIHGSTFEPPQQTLMSPTGVFSSRWMLFAK